jgi:hypothetical protein
MSLTHHHVGPLQAIYHRLLCKDHEQQHLYEFITPETPCHLHLDLEVAANDPAASDATVDMILAAMASALQHNYGLTINCGINLELDS